MVSGSSRAPNAQKIAIFLVMALATAHSALAAPSLIPPHRVGYTNGDQWEPALAADGHGHVYIFFPQYGAVTNCPACTTPTLALLISDDNGVSWEPPRPLLPSALGQFDAQIKVDPVDQIGRAHV